MSVSPKQEELEARKDRGQSDNPRDTKDRNHGTPSICECPLHFENSKKNPRAFQGFIAPTWALLFLCLAEEDACVEWHAVLMCRLRWSGGHTLARVQERTWPRVQNCKTENAIAGLAAVVAQTWAWARARRANRPRFRLGMVLALLLQGSCYCGQCCYHFWCRCWCW